MFSFIILMPRKVLHQFLTEQSHSIYLIFYALPMFHIISAFLEPTARNCF